MHRSLAVLLAVIILAAALPSAAEDMLPLPILSPDMQANLAQYLDDFGQQPEEYVLGKFYDHDVVILGEQHRARQDPLLVQNLIPRLPDIGVYTLCTEFARRVDQPLIDSLLSGDQYDEKLAELIQMQQFVQWGYQEYVDIFKAAWQYNHDRPEGSRAFRILGVNNAPDWYYIVTQGDRQDPDILKQVVHGESEKDWADCVLHEVTDKGEKALAYCGINHGFTEFRQPVVVDGKFIRYVEDRFGTFLYEALGKRVITIYLHNYWEAANDSLVKYVYPADGYIDALMEELGPDSWGVGFDTHDSPFGNLPGTSSIYEIGYDGFRLSEFCDGYIFQKPFRMFEPVTCIDSFYTEDNIDYCQSNAVNPWFRDKPIQIFQDACEQDRKDELRRWAPLQ